MDISWQIQDFECFFQRLHPMLFFLKNALVPISRHAAVKLSTENMEIKKLLKIVAHFYYLKQF